MVKKIALNVFYNLAIIVSVIAVIWCYNNQKYLFIPLFLASAAFFVYVKIQLMKEVRKNLKR